MESTITDVILEEKIKSLIERWNMIRDNYSSFRMEDKNTHDIITWIIEDLEALLLEENNNQINGEIKNV